VPSFKLPAANPLSQNIELEQISTLFPVFHQSQKLKLELSTKSRSWSNRQTALHFQFSDNDGVVQFSQWETL